MSRQVIPVNNIHTVGLIKDTPAIALPSNGYSDVKNIRFTNGSIQKMTGEVELISQSVLSSYNNNLGVGEVVYTAWWNNPNLTPNNGYFIVVGQANGLDSLYVIDAKTLTIESLDFKVPSGGTWQHTVFQGGYAFVLNNGVARPVYILDETGNTNISELEAYELPGWDSYYTKEEAVNDVYDPDIHIPDFDLGRKIDFTLEEVIVNVIDSTTKARKFSNTHTTAGTELQTTLVFDSTTNTHFVSIALAAGGVGENAFTEFLESGDQVIVTIRSLSTVQVRCGVIRSWGDTLVAGNLTEINAPLVNTVTQASNQIEFSSDHKFEVGDKIYLTVPYKDLLTVDTVVNSTTITVTEDLQVADYSVTRYTIVSSGKSIRTQPGVVRISDVAAPGSIPNNWNPYSAGVSTAEEFQLSTTGIVQDLVQLQGGLYVYTDMSIHALSKTGNTSIPYVSSVVTNNYGALGLDCVVEFNGIHIVVGSDDIYQFSGHPASVKSICVDRVQKYFYDNIDPSYLENTKIVVNKANNEIWFCYIKGTSNNLYDEVLVWNFSNNTWTIRSQTPFSSITIGQTKSYDNGLSTNINPHTTRPILSDPNTIFASDFKDVYTKANGDLYESYIERTDMSMAPEFDVESISSIALWVDTNSTNTVNTRLRVRTTDAPGKTIDTPLTEGSTGPTNPTFVIGKDYKTDVRLTGRLLHLRYTDEGVIDTDWKVIGMQYEIGKGGRR